MLLQSSRITYSKDNNFFALLKKKTLEQTYIEMILRNVDVLGSVHKFCADQGVLSSCSEEKKRLKQTNVIGLIVMLFVMVDLCIKFVFFRFFYIFKFRVHDLSFRIIMYVISE